MALLVLAALGANGQEVEDIEYLSTADQSRQRAIFFDPKSKEVVPLVVVLHTWSGNYKQKFHEPIRKWCMEKGWAYLHPDFRGPARRPEATGSDLVVKDIVSAVEFAKKTSRIDASAEFLVGTSGGGYHCLVMAGRHPEIWSGVSAWASISDLKAWYEEQKGKKYGADIVKSCGGIPGDSAEVDRQYRLRSPLSYLARAKGKVALHINAGIKDGHTGSVPISHSLLAFNEVAEPAARISEEEIRFFTERAQVPESLKKDAADASYGKNQPLFRRSSASATITIFDGGHEIVQPAAIAWMEALYEHSRK